jgi:hypothetical protein
MNMPAKKSTLTRRKATAAKSAAKKPAAVSSILEDAGMKKNSPKGRQVIDIEPLALAVATFEIESLSPMLLQCLSDKSKKQMEEGRAGTKKKKKEYGTPEDQAKDAISGYLIGGKFGRPWTKSSLHVPNSWFKNMLINVAGRHVDALKLNTAGGVFQVVESMVPISHKGISIHEGWVKVPAKTGAPVLRFRGMLEKWSCTFSIRYNTGMINSTALAVIVETAGFANGLGDFRPQKNGHYGQFQIKRAS